MSRIPAGCVTLNNGDRVPAPYHRWQREPPLTAGAGQIIRKTGHNGFTLVELVIALVVIAAAAAGVLLVYAQTVLGSADPLLRAQARSIAEAYMDEALARAYEDPDGSENGNGGNEGDCGDSANADVSEGESRDTYDDVWDYHSIGGESPTTQIGNVVSGLDAFTVDMFVNGNHGSTEATVIVCVRHDSGRVDYRLVSERWDLS